MPGKYSITVNPNIRQSPNRRYQGSGKGYDHTRHHYISLEPTPCVISLTHPTRLMQYGIVYAGPQRLKQNHHP